MTDKLLGEAEAYIRALFAREFSGHDAAHTLRVYRMALRLASSEGADPEITGLAALLHDADDRKLSPETHETLRNAVSFLRGQGVPEATVESVCRIIRQVSFRGTDSVTPDTPEGRCVQDADRLDAIGAVGVARAFAFGGSRGRAMHDPSEPPVIGMDAGAYENRTSSTVNHFYEKLLLLKDMLCTEEARRIAAGRDRFMREFLEEFLEEWDGRR